VNPVAADRDASRQNERMTPEQILELARQAPSPFQLAVATDADGTLWARDVGDELFLHVAAQQLFREGGIARMRAHATALMGHAAAEGAPHEVANALFARYSAGQIDVRVMCDLQAEAIGDRPEREFAALIAHVAERVAATVRHDVRAILRAARGAGAQIHVVTGSLGLAVEATLRRAGVPFDRVTGAALMRADGHVHARIQRTSPLFDGKVDALRDAGSWPAAIGLGDGGWDHPFLRQVYIPVLVRPKPALLEAMRDVPRTIVLSGAWDRVAPDT
jgi:phosphoserine phosphatase